MSLDDLVKNFFILLTEEFRDWYFPLNESIKWFEFKDQFIKKALKLEINYINLRLMKQIEFMIKLQTDAIKDKKLCDEKVMSRKGLFKESLYFIITR